MKTFKEYLESAASKLNYTSHIGRRSIIEAPPVSYLYYAYKRGKVLQTTNLETAKEYSDNIEHIIDETTEKDLVKYREVCKLAEFFWCNDLQATCIFSKLQFQIIFDKSCENAKNDKDKITYNFKSLLDFLHRFNDASC